MKPAWVVLMCGLCAASLAGDEGARGIVPEEVLQARPPAKGGGTALRAPSRPSYRSAAGNAMPRRAEGRQIGVTIWKLRKAAGDEEGARILVQEELETTAWVPERVSSANRLRAGDRVRLSIESPEAGYLYVIDRERYASGERGVPYLIFPTTRTRGGDNRVSGGRLVDIPAQDDRPNFFTLRASRADQSEEELTVLLTPKPLEGVETGSKPVALAPEQAEQWERQWSAKVDTFELAGGAGRRWTAAEQRAAADGTRVLTQDDPAPQTVYRVEGGKEGPLLVKVRLRYGGGTAAHR